MEQTLLVVTPDTVLGWRRRRLREYWTRCSDPPTGGRPPVNAKIAPLFSTMIAATLLWGAPRTHGEVLKLGLAVSSARYPA